MKNWDLDSLGFVPISWESKQSVIILPDMKFLSMDIMKEMILSCRITIKVAFICAILILLYSPQIYAARFSSIAELEAFLAEGRLDILGLIIFLIAIAAYILKPFWSKTEKTIGLAVLILSEAAIIWGFFQ